MQFVTFVNAILQHVVFGVCKLIDILVPDVPEALELKIKRERYLAKQALADTDAIMKVNTNYIMKQGDGYRY